MLYRGMDRAQLDAAYNNLAAVPSSPKLLADWAARSAHFRERHHGHLGLAYGERPRERLDPFRTRSQLRFAPTTCRIPLGRLRHPPS